MTELINNISGFLSKSWLPNLVGLVGGLLGLWTFIDTYVFRFKPKIFIGTRILFHARLENNYLRLKSIIASLKICNHRKKYGVVYDLAFRIYKADEINPDSAIYYSSEQCEKVPIEIEKKEDVELTSYNPITVLPSSNKSVNIFFSEIMHRSEIEVNPESSYFLEAYYQLKPKGKWKYIDKLYLFNKGYLSEESKEFIQFSVLNTDATREKLKKRIRPQKTNLYQGATQKFIKGWYRRMIYRIFKYPYYRLKDVFISIPFYTHFAIDWIIDVLVKIPILKRYNKTIDKANITFGNKKLRPVTDNSFEKIFNELEKLAKKINKDSNKATEVKVEKKNGQIILSRYKLAIKFYIAGDTDIYVQELNPQYRSRLTYNLKLRNSIWRRNFWYLDNYGFITLKSFVIRVMDAFVIHSNY